MYRYFIFAMCACLMLSIACFGLSVADFKTNCGIQEAANEPLFLDTGVVITVEEDGTKFPVKKLNPYYDELVRIPYEEIGLSGRIIYMVENEAYYFILDNSEENILFKFDEESNYLIKYGADLKIRKEKEFDDVILYHLNMMGNDDDDPFVTTLRYEGYYLRTLHFWIGKNTQTGYSGNVCFPPKFKWSDYNYKVTAEDIECYEHIKDAYAFIAEEEIKRCEDALKNDIDYIINSEAHEATGTINKFDKELASQFYNRIEAIRLSQNKSVKDKAYNINRISLYVQPVSEFKKIYRATKIAALIEHANNGPGFEGDLPTNDEELEKFLVWIKTPMPGGRKVIDYFDTAVKFEMISEGVKVLSAGRDKAWDTEDDQYVLRTYESVGMKPLN